MNILSLSIILGISFFLFLSAYKTTVLQDCKNSHFSNAIENKLNRKFKIKTPIYQRLKWESLSCQQHLNLNMSLKTNIDYEKSNR